MFYVISSQSMQNICELSIKILFWKITLICGALFQFYKIYIPHNILFLFYLFDINFKFSFIHSFIQNLQTANRLVH